MERKGQARRKRTKAKLDNRQSTKIDDAAGASQGREAVGSMSTVDTRWRDEALVEPHKERRPKGVERAKKGRAPSSDGDAGGDATIRQRAAHGRRNP